MLVRLAVVLALIGCREKGNAPKSTPGDPASADAPTKNSLAQELEAIRNEHELPALAAAVWRGGKLVEIEAVGLRKADDPTSKVTTKDYWHLGSNTKAMTAMLIGIYVDRGALKWEDSLDKWFKNIDPGYAKVTIDQLLRHEGGAPAQPPDALWQQLWADGDKPDARAKFVAGILARPPAQEPGTYVYSNAGYIIAGAALETLTSKRWEHLMRDELFGKLGMVSCGFGAPGRKDVERPDHPWGHGVGGTPNAPGPAADNPPGLGPAGTVHCSLEDYGKFLAVHSTGQPAILSPETLRHLQTARDMGYAGGWRVMRSPRGTVLGHSGSNTMWYATAIVVLATKLEDRIVLVMATNSGSNAIEEAIERLVARHLKRK